jgi:hypothetical protein
MVTHTVTANVNTAEVTIAAPTIVIFPKILAGSVHQGAARGRALRVAAARGSQEDA